MESKYVPGDDCRIREEEDPDTVPALAVRGDDFVLVRDPVLVPAEDGRGVVHAEDVDAFDFEAGFFALVDDPGERAGGVGAGEDVFVHEEAPVVGDASVRERCQRGRGDMHLDLANGGQMG